MSTGTQELTQAIVSVADDEHDVKIDDAHHYLTFLLNNKVYGVEITRIKEILEFSSITRVPMTPDYISGVLNLRGNVVPVINLARRLGKPASDHTKKTCILIIEVRCDGNPMDIGIVVDSVNEVIGITEAELEPPPSFGVDIRTDFISNMGRSGKDFIVLLDVDKVLDVAELAMFDSSQTSTVAN